MSSGVGVVDGYRASWRSGDPEFESVLRANYRRDVSTGHVDMFRAIGQARPDYRGYTKVQEREILPFLDQLHQPTLLIWSGADATVPVARGEALGRLIPGAQLRVVDDAGHWVMHDAPDLFAKMVREAT